VIKRPLNPRFSNAVREGRKTTTIRDGIWPVGVPIMLYNWSGTPYRSKQVDVAAVLVREARAIRITHREDGGMLYAYGQQSERYIHETEGFSNRLEMDCWFRPLVKPGQTITKHLMLFRLATEAEVKGGVNHV
jgi:hypothetical protein